MEASPLGEAPRLIRTPHSGTRSFPCRTLIFNRLTSHHNCGLEGRGLRGRGRGSGVAVSQGIAVVISFSSVRTAARPPHNAPFSSAMVNHRRTQEVAAAVSRHLKAPKVVIQDRVAALLRQGQAGAELPKGAPVEKPLQRFAQRKEAAREAKLKSSHKRRDVAVVDKRNAQTGVVATPDSVDAPTLRSPAEAQGLKLLRRAVRNQSHLRVLPFHERHDFEYRLRRVATSGVVQLFNAVAAAQAAGKEQLATAEENALTLDKAEANKVTATKEAFMSALRSAASSARTS